MFCVFNHINVITDMCKVKCKINESFKKLNYVPI